MRARKMSHTKRVGENCQIMGWVDVWPPQQSSRFWFIPDKAPEVRCQTPNDYITILVRETVQRPG